MKTIMTLVFTVLSSCALAETETIDGVSWTFRLSGGEAILGGGSKSSTAVAKDTAGKIVIPEILGGLPVRIIDSYAFYDCVKLTDVEIPESVRTICSMAFLGCVGLDEIVIPASVRVMYWDSFLETTNGPTYSGLYGCVVSKFFFKGNRPMINGSAANDRSGFYQATIYCIQGMEGWELGIWVNGVVKYGAAMAYFEPIDGVLDVDRKVALTSSNSTAELYYTTDGSEPMPHETRACHRYSGQFHIDPNTTVKALAYVVGYPYTVTYSRTFALGQTACPLIVAAGEDIFNYSDYEISMTTETDDAVIRYTLDGSEPTENSKLYTGPFTIDDTTTIKAKAFKTDWFDSLTATATFTREWYTVETPVIEPTEAEFANVAQEVSIACATDGAAIYYTTDGSDPAQNGLEYKRPFTIYKSCIVKAIAKKYDWKNSIEATATFTRTEGLSEASNLFGYTMESDENAPWVVDSDMSHDGVSSVRSGTIGNNGVTTLSVSLRKTGTVSFWWRAKCEDAEEEGGETYYYDYGSFAVDGNVVARIAGNDTGWQYVSHEIATGGKHVLSWEYRKDGATSYSPDCIWVDQVQWIPADGSGYTLTTPEPVPYSWLDQYNLGVGTDYETAGNAASGKMNWGKPSAVWEEYVAGLDPTDANSRLVANIEMRDGALYVSWTPDLNTNGIIRTYKVYGSKTLENGGNWQYPTNSLHRFFRVKVEMP